MRKIVLFSIFFCACLLSAQTPTPASPPIGGDGPSLAFHEMEIFSRSVREARDDEARQIAEKRAEQFAREQFCEKANKFIALWEDFAARVNEKQTFDAKLAKKLSRAFHALETSDGWPVRDGSQNTGSDSK